MKIENTLQNGTHLLTKIFPIAVIECLICLFPGGLPNGHKAKVFVYVIREVSSNKIIGLVPLILWRRIFNGLPVRLLETLGRGIGTDELLILNNHISCIEQVFIDLCKRARWDVLKFLHLSSESSNSLQTILSSVGYSHHYYLIPNFLINLEGTFESYIMGRSKNFRKNVNK